MSNKQSSIEKVVEAERYDVRINFSVNFLYCTQIIIFRILLKLVLATAMRKDMLAMRADMLAL